MEIRDLARAVLLSPRLDDKLIHLDEPLTDRVPGPALTEPPAEPARPPALRLGGGRRKMRFPGAGQLGHPEARGRALHFFANHELLAMELMALALLRFPQAPASFRRGVARTLLEEQDHLRRYQRRMHALGVGLGDVPVSDFFWATMADMGSPLDYVVRMSLTFEQANLDHAKHYATLFREASDPETATLMDLVYEEELGHVKHGVVWFNRWRHAEAPTADESDWAAYNRLLPAPLSARRARGQPYVFAARTQVGLSATFAEELEIYSHSRGRSPTVWLFEPNFELEHGTASPAAPRPVREVATDLAPVMMYLAASDDVVVAPIRPRASVLTTLARAGFDIPEFCTAAPSEAADALSARAVGGVQGWGESRRVTELRRAFGLPAEAGSSPAASSKIWAAERLAELAEHCPTWARVMGPAETVGRACGDFGALDAARARLYEAGFDEVVVKRPFSSSGQGRLRHSTSGPWTDRRWLERAWADGPLLVEPWLDRRGDLSILLEVEARDAREPRPLRVPAMPFLTGRGGVYRGHVLADPTFGLSSGLQKKLAFEAEGGFSGRLAELGAFVRQRLAQVGHRGPAAVDLLVFCPPGVHHEDEWAVKPIVEINARRTMGHVAWALRQHIAPGRFGVWLHRPLRPDDATRPDRWPRPKTQAAGRRRQIVEGLLATTDPAMVRRVWSVLVVASDLAQVRALVREHLDEGALGSLSHLG